MKYSVFTIFIVFIFILSVIRFLSIDNFIMDTDANTTLAISDFMLSSNDDPNYYCIKNYINDIKDSIDQCDVTSSDIYSQHTCKKNAHIEQSGSLSSCLEDLNSHNLSIPDLPVQKTATASIPVTKITVPSEPVVPQNTPCDKLKCYMDMVDRSNSENEFNSKTDLEYCINCDDDERMDKTNVTFEPWPGVTNDHTPYDWSKHDTPDSIKYPGNGDNYANYCNWGLVKGWCSENNDFRNACRNECP